MGVSKGVVSAAASAHMMLSFPNDPPPAPPPLPPPSTSLPFLPPTQRIAPAAIESIFEDAGLDVSVDETFFQDQWVSPTGTREKVLLFLGDPLFQVRHTGTAGSGVQVQVQVQVARRCDGTQKDCDATTVVKWCLCCLRRRNRGSDLRAGARACSLQVDVPFTPDTLVLEVAARPKST